MALKTNKEIVQEMAEVIFDAIAKDNSGSKIMLAPALNIVKMKMAQMTEKDCDFIVDSVHKISRRIEIETGVFSPYHGLDDTEPIDTTKSLTA